MANYTIALYEIERAKNFNLFDNYDFYEESKKEEFEKKFFNRYLMREIYCESIYLFKRQLLGKLNEIMPYYKQVYEAELKSKNIEFLLNKDLKETFEREIESNGNQSSENSSKGSSTNKLRNKFYDTPQQEITDLNGYLTNVTNNDNENSDTSEGKSSSQQIGKQSEKTTLTSQGNIGTTSSAELLQKWYDVLINIDSMILDDLSELFLDLY